MARATKTYAFEDLTPGRQFDLGPYRVTAEEIAAFNLEFDAPPGQLETAGGQGGRPASVWHVCCMMMRMLIDGYIGDSTSQGAPGVDYCNWFSPVLAGDTLYGRSTVSSARSLASRPGIGVVNFEHRLFNQRGETVCTSANTGFFALRNPGEAP